MKSFSLRKSLLLLTGAIGLCGAPLVASADPILSDLGSTSGSTNYSRVNSWYAYKFETGATGSVVRSISVDVDQFFQPDQWQGAVLRLYSGTNAPTTLLGTFAIYDYTSGNDIANFGDLNSAVTLDPGTTYWLGFSGILANAYFRTTSSPTYDPAGLSGYIFDTTANLSSSPGTDTGWDAPFSWGEVPVVALNSTAVVVPEPASVALVGMGGLLLLSRRFRRAS